MPTAPLIVLFDADGVVQSGPADFAARIAALLVADAEVDAGVDTGAVDAEAFLAALFEAELAALTGSRDFEEVVADTLSAHGCDPERAGELAALWHELETDSATVEAITTLRTGGTRCYLATNQHAFRTAYMRERLGYGDLFDGQFYSCELGVAKPDPAYFRRIVEELGVPAERVLFVDDSEANVRGAREAGLRAEVFHHQRDGADALRALLAGHGLA